MSNSGNTQAIEKLAAEIGENVYMDITKWNLYLGDANLHTPVAEKLYPILEEAADLEEETVINILKDTPVKLGGGKTTLSLADLIPSQVITDLMKLLEEFKKDM